MQQFENKSDSNDATTVFSEREELIEKKRKVRNEKIKEILKKVFPFFITIVAIVIIVNLFIIAHKHFKKELMATEEFELFDIKIDADDNRLYYSYLYSYQDEKNKLEKDSHSDYHILSNLYISDDDRNYVVVEIWGRQGKVKKKKITKYYFSEEQYKKMYDKFEWKEDTN